MLKFYLYVSICGAAFMSSLEEGRKFGNRGFIVGIISGLLISGLYFVITRFFGNMMLRKLEREESSNKAIRLFFAVVFALTFLIWMFSPYWAGIFLTKHALILTGIR